MKKEEFKITFCKAEELEKDFTQVPNALWSTKQLSLEDKTVLGYLLSHKDGFKANKTFLAAGLGVSRKFFIDSFKRLQEFKVVCVTESNTLTFNLSVVSVTQSNTISVTQSDTLNEVLPKVTDSVTQSDTIVLPKVTDSVTESNTNNIIDNKNKQKEEQKEFQGNDNIVSKILPSVTQSDTLNEVLPKVTDNTILDNMSVSRQKEESKQTLSRFFFGMYLQDVQDFHIKISKEFKMNIPTDKFEKIMVYIIVKYNLAVKVDIDNNQQLNEGLSNLNLSTITKDLLEKNIKEMKDNIDLVEAITNKLIIQ